VIYLILDTNIWIYLSNGFDPLTENHSDDLHFELLDTLKKSKDSGDISILVNDVIIEEWKRNKEHSKLKIKKLLNKLANVDQVFGDIRKYVDTEKIRKEYTDKINEEIKRNEEHILSVENFLIKDCVIIKTSDKIKIKIFDLSISKTAPFHNKNNNIADASILFGTSEYMSDKFFSDEDSVIFVSNNFKDFTDNKNKEEFHPDIKEQLIDVPITYQRALPSALKLSQELILEIQKYLKQQEWLDSISFDCQTPFCKGNENLRPWGYLSEQVKVDYGDEKFNDPNQLKIFPELPEPPMTIKMTSYGDCVVCGVTHIICPDCEELFYIDDIDSEFNCPVCECTLEFNYDREGNHVLLVKPTVD